MVKTFVPARFRNKAERQRIRSKSCMICWRRGPSYVYDAGRRGYGGWLGLLWPLCLYHRWMAQVLGWKGLLERYQVDASNDPEDLKPLYR